MENENKFPEQEAPEKNTDRAFVQVGEDGHPVIPQPINDKIKEEENNLITPEEEQN